MRHGELLLTGPGADARSLRSLGAPACRRKPQDCRIAAAMPHTPSALHWDDLKHLLAVARHGSTLAAGRALQVDQSTVQRRLVELERRIGQSLVQRQPTGYRLTELGQELLPFAEAVETAVQALEERLKALREDAAGVIRMTCPEPIVRKMTQAGLLDRFHARHPRLQVQFVMSDRYLDLARATPTSPCAPATPTTLRSPAARSAIRTGRSTRAAATSSGSAAPPARSSSPATPWSASTTAWPGTAPRSGCAASGPTCTSPRAAAACSA